MNDFRFARYWMVLPATLTTGMAVRDYAWPSSRLPAFANQDKGRGSKETAMALKGPHAALCCKRVVQPGQELSIVFLSTVN